eukprot:m51a1_g1179 hypothetical protein (79) ;mRNA; r:387919-388155
MSPTCWSQEAERQAKLELDRVQHRRDTQDNDELEVMMLAIAAHLAHLPENRYQLGIEAIHLRAILMFVKSDERAFLIW